MSKQKQITKGQSNNKKSLKNNKPKISTKRTADQAILEELSKDLAQPTDNPTLQTVVARLHHTNFQTVQRQAIVAQIGQSKGNRCAQYVVTGLNQDKAATQLPLVSNLQPSTAQTFQDSPQGNVIQRLAHHATAIITVAQDTRRPMNERAIEVVQRIINQYFSSDASKVRGIIYRESVPGLEVETASYQPRTGGPTATAKLVVGSNFVQSTDTRHFARRVQQVRHELDHIDQVRAGMGNPSSARDFESYRHEREFLAHYRGVFYSPPEGTGRIAHSTRVQIIDEALGHYYCLSDAKKRQYASEQQRLLTQRPTEVDQSGRSFGDPPTSCSGS